MIRDSAAPRRELYAGDERAEKRRGGRAALTLALILLAPLTDAAGAAGLKEPFDAMGVHRPAEPFPTPEVAFEALDGREARLGDLRGKVVLLGFFTTS